MKCLHRHSIHFTDSGTTPYQYASTFDQHGMTNQIRPGHFLNNAQNFDAIFQNQFNQEKGDYSFHKGYDQSSLMEEGQWWNRIDPWSVNNSARNQNPLSEQHHRRCVNQAPYPERKPPRFQQDTTRPQQFGNPQNIHTQYFSRPPCVDDTNPHSEEAPRSIDSTGNFHSFLGNPQNIHPQFRAQPPCEGKRNLYSLQPPLPVDSKKAATARTDS